LVPIKTFKFNPATAGALPPAGAAGAKAVTKSNAAVEGTFL